MIILPDRNISRSRFLMAVPHREWMPPSRAQQKTFCGDEDRTRFRLRAKTHDGYVVWTGWFEDRNDADAFLFALVSGSLIYERELWRLPTPEWHPGVSPDLFYNFVTQTILTTTGSNQTYTSPSDWNNSSNQIECLGAAGSGGTRISASGHGAGGGAGAYSAITNFTFASPGTTTATYRVGSGGAGVSGSTAGNAGGPTWFNDTVNPGVGTTNAKCSAANGSGGGTGRPANGGAGGLASASWGQTKFDAGRGGNATAGSGYAATGGGGAAGPAGAGGNGVDRSTTGQSAGGSANDGTTAGGSAGSAGSSGTEFSPSFGCGSGGGGETAAGTSTGNAGGNYGGASGGSASGGSTATSAAGRQGLVIIEYTPLAISLANNNLPMLGM